MIFIHNYFLNGRFVMQDGIIHRSFREQEPVLCSEQLYFRFFISLHFSVHRVISTAFYLLPSVVTAFLFIAFSCLFPILRRGCSIKISPTLDDSHASHSSNFEFQECQISVLHIPSDRP